MPACGYRQKTDRAGAVPASTRPLTQDLPSRGILDDCSRQRHAAPSPAFRLMPNPPAVRSFPPEARLLLFLPWHSRTASEDATSLDLPVGKPLRRLRWTTANAA